VTILGKCAIRCAVRIVSNIAACMLAFYSAPCGRSTVVLSCDVVAMSIPLGYERRNEVGRCLRLAVDVQLINERIVNMR